MAALKPLLSASSGTAKGRCRSWPPRGPPSGATERRSGWRVCRPHLGVGALDALDEVEGLERRPVEVHLDYGVVRVGERKNPEVISASEVLWAGSHSPTFVMVTGLTLIWSTVDHPNFGLQLGTTDTTTVPLSPLGHVELQLVAKAPEEAEQGRVAPEE